MESKRENFIKAYIRYAAARSIRSNNDTVYIHGVRFKRYERIIDIGGRR